MCERGAWGDRTVSAIFCQSRASIFISNSLSGRFWMAKIFWFTSKNFSRLTCFESLVFSWMAFASSMKGSESAFWFWRRTASASFARSSFVPKRKEGRLDERWFPEDRIGEIETYTSGP